MSSMSAPREPLVDCQLQVKLLKPNDPAGRRSGRCQYGARTVKGVPSPRGVHSWADRLTREGLLVSHVSRET